MSDFLAVLREHSHLGQHYENFLATIDNALGERPYALLQHQVAWIHGLQEQRETPQNEAEAVLLQVAEHMPLAYREVSDGMVSRLAQHYGARGAVSVLVAAAFFDVNVRLNQIQGSRNMHVGERRVD